MLFSVAMIPVYYWRKPVATEATDGDIFFTDWPYNRFIIPFIIHPCMLLLQLHSSDIQSMNDTMAELKRKKHSRPFS